MQAPAGRESENIDIAPQFSACLGNRHEMDVPHIAGILFAANSVSEYKEQMQRFAEDVMPHFPTSNPIN